MTTREVLLLHRAETEIFFHRLKIAIVVQQGVTVLDAKSADDDIGRLADCDAASSQLTIIAGGARGQINVQEGHEHILAECALDPSRMSVVASALEDFEQDKVADQQRLPASESFQLAGGGGLLASQMCDPNGAVDQNHGRFRERP